MIESASGNEGSRAARPTSLRDRLASETMANGKLKLAAQGLT